MSPNKDDLSSLSVESSENPIITEHKRSKSPSILNRILHKNSNEKKDKEEIPPRLQEAIKEMEERKAQKEEEMERDGKKPNKKTAGAGVHAVQGAVGALGSLAAGLSLG